MRRARFAKRMPLVLSCLMGVVQAPATFAQDAAPAEAEQQKILGAIRQYSEDYIAKLPNFVCQQITEEFEADRKGKHWRKQDALSEKLVFSGGREQRTLELVNNKQVRNGNVRVRRVLSTEGEFGILLSKIFDEDSAATFSWGGWDTVRGHRVAKFDYAIDRKHSSLSLTNFIKATVSYGGSVYGDPETGAVWRVTSGSTEIPEAVQISSIATTIEYEEVSIGTQKYLLPVTATVLVVAAHDQTRNELRFEGYRKFEAESTISFGSPETSDNNGADKTPKPQR
jgi:hypothetical protein